CNLRMDDTNPTKEEVEYVESIQHDVTWLISGWADDKLGLKEKVKPVEAQVVEGTSEFFEPAVVSEATTNASGTPAARLEPFYASDYFDQIYEFAVQLIRKGRAYVCDLSPEDTDKYRGTPDRPGTDSPFRTRPVEESLDLFARMKAGEFPDGTRSLRAKIDMAAPNIWLRDPLLYRIRHASHHQTGDKWCIYPLYDYTHCISDALEGITHSICTLEFQDHRPLYDWIIDKLADGGQLTRPLPQQYEFARLNLTCVLLSKRKLIELVDNGLVDGWDDPRMPTLVGARRRGFTPEGFRLFAERIGVSKSDSWIDMSVLEDCMREDLNARAERRIAVLDPVRLVIDNYPDDQEEECFAPNHPQQPERGRRGLPFSRELWIERDDFQEHPEKGYFRLSPGAEVRLRYAYIVRCEGVDKDAAGKITAIHCRYDPETRSGTAGADTRKVKGNIHWLSVLHAVPAEVRLYDRFFAVPFPGARHPWGLRADGTSASPAIEVPAPGHATVLAGDEDESVETAERNYVDDLNPDSKRVITAFVEPALNEALAEECFQFERHGYFVADINDHSPGRPVFNRAVTLRDTWDKRPGQAHAKPVLPTKSATQV
ncbi:MAG: glutamine--tRNA ligase, partial [Vicinamibacterales bacterium]